MAGTSRRASKVATMAFVGLAAASSGGAQAAPPFGAVEEAIRQGLTRFQKAHNLTRDPADSQMFQALGKRYAQAVEVLPNASGPVVTGVGITASDGVTTVEQWGVKLNKDGSAEIVVRPQEMDPQKVGSDKGCVVSALTAGSCFQVYHAAKVDPQGRISPLDPASYSLVPFGVRDGDRVTPFSTKVRPATTAEELKPPADQPDTVDSVRQKLLRDFRSPKPDASSRPPAPGPKTLNL